MFSLERDFRRTKGEYFFDQWKLFSKQGYLSIQQILSQILHF